MQLPVLLLLLLLHSRCMLFQGLLQEWHPGAGVAKADPPRGPSAGLQNTCPALVDSNLFRESAQKNQGSEVTENLSPLLHCAAPCRRRGAGLLACL